MTDPGHYDIVARPYDASRRQLATLGLPPGDDTILATSERRFDDGGQYRIEVPTVNSPAAASAILTMSRSRGFLVNRITETYGLYRHTDSEVGEYVAIGREFGAEIVMSVGPRASHDIGASVQTAEGVRIGYRLRGQEQVVRAIEDVRRGIELGVRSFVVYDEGLLWVLSRLRTTGELPANIRLKVSAHCGHGNPASALLLETLGADSFNPVRDLTLPIIASIRAALSIPMDLHVDNPKSSGGFVRTYDAPEFVRIAAPVYLKTGNSALERHGARPTDAELDAVVRQVEIVAEFMRRHYPQAQQSTQHAQLSTSSSS